MSDYKSFSVEQYDKVFVLILKHPVTLHERVDDESRDGLCAFIVTTKPRCVAVSFSEVARCSSSLIGGLVGLNKYLKEQSGCLVLCEMSQSIREQFGKLNLNRFFNICGRISDAITACEEARTDGGEHVKTKAQN